MDQMIELNTDKMEPPAVGNDLFGNRTAVAEMQGTDRAEVSILLLAYNRLDKTKRCIESILKNTSEVNYELILLDNGSTDGTQAYFKSIPYAHCQMI